MPKLRICYHLGPRENASDTGVVQVIRGHQLFSMLDDAISLQWHYIFAKLGFL